MIKNSDIRKAMFDKNTKKIYIFENNDNNK